MAYDTVKLDVERIKRRTRGTSGLRRVIAELSIEGASRTMKDAKKCEGSEKKGYLEEAISDLETAYRKHPDPKVASLLSETYRMLGDTKKAAGMPDYEDDYTQSAFYAEQAKALEAGNPSQRGPERNDGRTPHTSL